MMKKILFILFIFINFLVKSQVYQGYTDVDSTKYGLNGTIQTTAFTPDTVNQLIVDTVTTMISDTADNLRTDLLRKDAVRDSAQIVLKDSLTNVLADSNFILRNDSIYVPKIQSDSVNISTFTTVPKLLMNRTISNINDIIDVQYFQNNLGIGIFNYLLDSSITAGIKATSLNPPSNPSSDTTITRNASGEQFIVGWTFPSDFSLSLFEPGLYVLRLHAARTVGSRDVRLLFRITETNTNYVDVDTIMTSAYSDYVTDSTSLTISASLSEEDTIATGNLYALKLYADFSASPAVSTNISVYYKGKTYARIETPTDKAILDNIYQQKNDTRDSVLQVLNDSSYINLSQLNDSLDLYALLNGRTGGQTLSGGIGTTDDLTLKVTSGVGTTGANMIFQGGNNGATEFARFLNNGDFGLGVNTPSSRLHVIGTTTVPLKLDVTGGGATTSNSFIMQTGGVNRWGFGQAVLNAGHHFDIYDYTNAKVTFIIDNTSYIGFNSWNTGSPLTYGHFNFSASSTILGSGHGVAITNTNATPNNLSEITLGQSSTNLTLGAKIGGQHFSRTGGSEGTSVYIQALRGGSLDTSQFNYVDSIKWYIGGSEKMRLHSNGFLGLNTITPSKLLDVNGDVIFRGDTLIHNGDTAVNSNNKTVHSIDTVKYKHMIIDSSLKFVPQIDSSSTNSKDTLYIDFTYNSQWYKAKADTIELDILNFPTGKSQSNFFYMYYNDSTVVQLLDSSKFSYINATFSLDSAVTDFINVATNPFDGKTIINVTQLNDY